MLVENSSLAPPSLSAVAVSPPLLSARLDDLDANRLGIQNDPPKGNIYGNIITYHMNIYDISDEYDEIWMYMEVSVSS